MPPTCDLATLVDRIHELGGEVPALVIEGEAFARTELLAECLRDLVALWDDHGSAGLEELLPIGADLRRRIKQWAGVPHRARPLTWALPWSFSHQVTETPR